MYITMTDCTIYRLDTFNNRFKWQLHCSRMQYSINISFTKIQYVSFNMGLTKYTACSRGVCFFTVRLIILYMTFHRVWPSLTDCNPVTVSKYLSIHLCSRLYCTYPSMHHPSIQPSIHPSIHPIIRPSLRPSKPLILQ